MTTQQNEKDLVKVDAGEFKREWHNYSRIMIVIATGCLISFVGFTYINGQWQARTEEKIISYGERLSMHDKQIESLNTTQGQVNGRLGVIEERTQSTIDGIKRIEGKLDKKQ